MMVERVDRQLQEQQAASEKRTTLQMMQAGIGLTGMVRGSRTQLWVAICAPVMMTVQALALYNFA